MYFPPADHPEYTHDIVDDIAAFYGGTESLRAGREHVAVEVQRGCPHRCYFCTEPAVKGRRKRTCDLDVVMTDVGFLAARGVSRVWFVCSELNIGNNKLLLELGRRMASSTKAALWGWPGPPTCSRTRR